MKNGIENDTKIKCDFEDHFFFMIFADFGSILIAQIYQKLEKNCIKKRSDFKTKLVWRPPTSDPSSWSRAGPSAAPVIRARWVKKRYMASDSRVHWLIDSCFGLMGWLIRWLIDSCPGSDTPWARGPANLRIFEDIYQNKCWKNQVREKNELTFLKNGKTDLEIK